MLTDNQISAIIGGALGLAGTVIGILGAVVQAHLAARRRREGVRKMLGHEIQTNMRQLEKWSSGSQLPVRSNYLWESLRGEAAGLLSHEEVVAVSDFYYDQARVYKRKPRPVRDVEVNALIGRARTALRVLGTGTA
jgi:hypothetical protein